MITDFRSPPFLNFTIERLLFAVRTKTRVMENEATAQANAQPHGEALQTLESPSGIAAPERQNTARLRLQQLVQVMSNADSASRLQAVRQTRELLTSASSHSNNELIVSRVLPLLVNCLIVDGEPELQLEAAKTLTNITGGTSEQTSAVFKAGPVPLLIQLLDSTHTHLDVCEQAVCVISNSIGMCPDLRTFNSKYSLIAE